MLFRARSKFRCMLILYITIPLFLIPLYFIYKPPHLLISYFQYRWKDVLWHVPTSKKIVALTIDDGPSAYTEEILSILKINDARATFFVIGAQVSDGREEVLQSIIRNGGELGNHAMHDEPSRSLSSDVLVEQISAVQAKVDAAYSATNTQPPRERYFRPGSGFFSTKMREVVRKMGYRLVLGSIYPHDPQIHNWRVNARHILSMLRPGAIVICHDRRAWTVPMLRDVLPEVRRRGYEVVSLTELIERTKT